ncbi:glycosyltransferase [Streptomyces nigra]|uniref:glycosyltransferase n=1 Tax=Streptomyces nigra TaxID=1827580 RepID=UPI0036EA6CD8
MDISEVTNPYDYRNPVRDAAVFAGRDEELATISHELVQAAVDRPSVCVVLDGPRAAGKTSLLNAAERMARAHGLTTVRVELIAGDGDPLVFFRKLYDELVAVITSGSEGPPLPFELAAVRRVMAGAGDASSVAPLQFPEAVALAGPGGQVPEAALRADLAAFVALLGHPIALMVDEAQVIADDARALSALRFLTSRVDGLVLVLAGTSGLTDRIAEVHSPILRQFRRIEVRRFIEDDEILACIERPLSKAGVFGLATQSLVSPLRQLTDGNPYAIQLYCHEMFERLRRGLTTDLVLTPELLADIRSRMESESQSGILRRPLIRAVRDMRRSELIAFNVLTSALDHATPDEAWFAYCLAGAPEITREEYDAYRTVLVAQGIVEDDDIVRLAIRTELFDEVYTRLWSAAVIGPSSHTQVTSRTDVRGMLTYRLLSLLHDFAEGPLSILPTCCSRMSASHVERCFDALERLPAAGPDTIPSIQYVHFAVLRAGEPRALDLTSVVCSYGDHTIERWLYAPDTDDIELGERADFKAAAERISALGGRLTAERVRQPLRSWPAEDWFQKATGRRRHELACNHRLAAFDAYGSGDLSRARAHFQSSFTLDPGWEQANCLAYLNLTPGLQEDALEWSRQSVALADNPWDRALSLYNTAMAHVLTGEPDLAAGRLTEAAAELNRIAMSKHLVDYLLLPAPENPALLREETDVGLMDAVQRAQAALGLTAQSPTDTSNEAQDPRSSATSTVQPSDRPPVVLSVATEWSSSHGGLSTFNRELCRALAAAGAQVFCVVLEATAEEMSAAATAGVTLLPARRIPGASADMRLAARPSDLPAGVEPDLILGHGRITGPPAQQLRDDLFPDARRLHFVHMAPDEIEWHKPDRGNDAGLLAEERTRIERSLGGTAHRVIAVGPRLYNQFLDEVRSPEGLWPERLDPGFDTEVPGAADRVPPKGRPLRVFLLGRIEDAELKGLDIAAGACGRVAQWFHAEGLRFGVRLVVRGAPESEVEASWKQIKAWAGTGRLNVVVRPYTAEQDRIEDDLRSAGLVIMPSRREGFGLVGLEAILAGIPVLVGSDSGLADLLREELGHEPASRFVVELSGDDHEDTEKWARAINGKLRDLEGAFRQAAELRRVLAGKVPWQRAADVVLRELPNR